jgi:hypothetical protein
MADPKKDGPCRGAWIPWKRPPSKRRVESRRGNAKVYRELAVIARAPLARLEVYDLVYAVR